MPGRLGFHSPDPPKEEKSACLPPITAPPAPPKNTGAGRPGYIGVIATDLSIAESVDLAAARCRQVCIETYGSAPDVIVSGEVGGVAFLLWCTLGIRRIEAATQRGQPHIA